MTGGGSTAVALLYALTALACFLAGSRAVRPWRWIGATLAVLAAERFFRVEAAVWRLGAAAAIGHGWYAGRRPAQAAAVCALAVVAALAIARAVLRHRRGGLPALLATVAALLLLAFVLVRAVSLHQIDRLLGTRLGPLTLANVVELGLLAIVAAAAVARMRNRGG